jgi:hypothetical protein
MRIAGSGILHSFAPSGVYRRFEFCTPIMPTPCPSPSGTPTSVQPPNSIPGKVPICARIILNPTINKTLPRSFFDSGMADITTGFSLADDNNKESSKSFNTHLRHYTD